MNKEKTYCAGCGSLLGNDTGEAEPDYNEDFCSKGCYKEFVNHEQGWDEKARKDSELLNACKHLVAILGEENEEFYNKHIEAFNVGIDAIANSKSHLGKNNQ